MAVSFDFTGQRIVVVGGARGLGRATVELISKLGGEVISLDRIHEDIAGVDCVSVDLADRASIAAAAEAVSGDIHGICNVAGVSSGSGFSPVDICRINYLGIRTLTEYLRPRLCVGGAIVCVSSSAARLWTGPEQALDALVAQPDYSRAMAWLQEHPALVDGYPLSKRALTTWAQSVVGELWSEKAARINVMTPGVMDTAMLSASAYGPRDELIAQAVAAGLRLIQPADQAWMVAFLVSPASSTLNGQLICADGNTR